MSLNRGRKFKKLTVAFIICAAFLFALFGKNVFAYHSTSTYDKPFNGTLDASEWNDLLADFANTWLPTNLAGPVGIGTTAPNDIFSIGGPGGGAALAGSPYTGHNFADTYLAEDGHALTNVNYVNTLIASATSSIPSLWATGAGNIWNVNSGSVGIGTTTPNAKLAIDGTFVNGDNYFSIADAGSTRFTIRKNTTNHPEIYSASTLEITAVGGTTLFKGTTGLKLQLEGGAGLPNELRSYHASMRMLVSGAYYLSFLTNDLERMRILHSGGIGIGTVAPQAPLDVNGLIKMRTASIVADEDVINKGYLDAALALATSSIITQVGTSSFWDGAVDGNIWSTNSGNVGIGTTSPSSRLSINGGTGAPSTGLSFGDGDTGFYEYSDDVLIGRAGGTDRLRIASTYLDLNNIVGARLLASNPTATSPNILPAANDPDTGIGWAGNNILSLIAGGTDVLNVNAAGYVGIGLTNPARPLDVYGTGTFGEPGAKVSVGFDFWGGERGVYDETIGDLIAGVVGYDIYKFGGYSPENGLAVDSASGYVGVGTTVPNDSFSIGGSGGTSALAGSPLTGHNHTNTYLSTDGYALTNYAIVESLIAAATSSLSVSGANFWGGTLNGNIWNGAAGAGNVGIGTTNPSRKLSVSGNVIIEAGEDSGAFVVYNGPNDNNQILVNGETNDVILSETSGNVGIGTSAPVQKLDVFGDARFGRAVSNNRYAIFDTSGRLTINYNDNTSAALNLITLRNLDAAAAIIHVNKINFSFARTADATERQAGGLLLGKESEWTSTITTNDSYFAIQAALDGVVSEKFRVSSSGNVGIGTVSPYARLEINGGDMYIWDLNSNPRFLIGDGAGGGNFGGFQWNSANDIVQIGTDTGGFLLNITEAGRVGIGTSAPNDSFSIGGSGGTSAPAGSPLTGHNYSNTYLSTDRFALTNYDIVETLIAAATSSLVIGSGTNFWGGALNGNIWNGDAGAGNVGIGTTNPGAFKLKVVGDVAITGTLLTQTGSDFAEEFKAPTPLAPGTVVVMGDEGYKSIKACTRRYDKTVVGIVSDNPSIIAGRTDADKANPEKVIVAMMGVVNVKATNMNGNIMKGDLLTSSDVSGYAMRASLNTPGSIIGKALENLDTKTGEVKVLVNLQ